MGKLHRIFIDISGQFSEKWPLAFCKRLCPKKQRDHGYELPRVVDALGSVPFSLLLAVLLLVLLDMGDAHARGSRAFMTTGMVTSQPIGHYEFCQRHAADCAVRARMPTPLHLTQKIWDMILDVNFSVNVRIEPATDRALYGREEYWEYPVSAGDCEDYVLQKRRELHESGLALSTLLMTVVRKPDGEGHAVLTIRTDRGDLVLDNLRDEVLNWSDTEYIYLKRQSEYHSGRWVAIEQPADLLVGSVRIK